MERSTVVNLRAFRVALAVGNVVDAGEEVAVGVGASRRRGRRRGITVAGLLHLRDVVLLLARAAGVAAVAALARVKELETREQVVVGVGPLRRRVAHGRLGLVVVDVVVVVRLQLEILVHVRELLVEGRERGNRLVLLLARDDNVPLVLVDFAADDVRLGLLNDARLQELVQRRALGLKDALGDDLGFDDTLEIGRDVVELQRGEVDLVRRLEKDGELLGAVRLAAFPEGRLDELALGVPVRDAERAQDVVDDLVTLVLQLVEELRAQREPSRRAAIEGPEAALVAAIRLTGVHEAFKDVEVVELNVELVLGDVDRAEQSDRRQRRLGELAVVDHVPVVGVDDGEEGFAQYRESVEICHFGLSEHFSNVVREIADRHRRRSVPVREAGDALLGANPGQVAAEHRDVGCVVIDLHAGIVVRPLGRLGDALANAVDDGLLRLVRDGDHVEVLEDGVANRRVDEKGEEGDAPDEEERALAVVVVVVGPRPHRVRSNLLDEDGERETDGAAEAAEGEESALFHADLVRAEQVEHGRRGEDDRAANDEDGGVEHDAPVQLAPVDVVRQLAAAHLDADEPKDHRVEDVLESAPHVLHGLLGDHHGPDAVRQDETRRDGGEDARGLANLGVVAQEEAEIGGDERDAELDERAGLGVAVRRDSNHPVDRDRADDDAEEGREEKEASHDADQAPHVGVLAAAQARHVEEDGEEDDRGTVVEERLARDLPGERLRGTEVLHEGEDGDGVGRGEDRADGHAEGPRPAVGQNVLDDERGQVRREENGGPGEEAGLLKGLEEGVDVDLHHVAKDERWEEDVEGEMAVDVGPHPERLLKRVELAVVVNRGEEVEEEAPEHDDHGVRDGRGVALEELLGERTQDEHDAAEEDDGVVVGMGVREVVVGRRRPELFELLLGPLDGVLEDEPRDELRAGRRRERARVGVELVGVVRREESPEVDRSLRGTRRVGPVRDAAVAKAASVVARLGELDGVEDRREGFVVGPVAIALDERAQDEEADAALGLVHVPRHRVDRVSPAGVEEDHVHLGRARGAADGVLGALGRVFAPVEVELGERVLVVRAVGAAHLARPVAKAGASLAVVDVVATDVDLDGVAVVVDEEEGPAVGPGVAEVYVGVVFRVEADVDLLRLERVDVDRRLAPL
mmetsp:Transcript_23055/g.72256  ORF Transcript_23055/g.72256 Transcript_23055/m.72256 type:complete len:1147 (-) Transcript_23055:553-3993(-)